MIVTLTRFMSNKDATYGAMTDGERVLAMTLEDPWLNNQRNVSCIPAGEYRVVPHSGLKYKNVWRLEDVPGRSAILIHQGNSTADTEGCILVGRWFSQDRAFLNVSRETLSWLRITLPSHFTLRIVGDQLLPARPTLENKMPTVRRGPHALSPIGSPFA